MKISIQEVKQAMRDPVFRKTLPESLKADIQKYEQNPGCACNVPIYQRVLKHAPKQLRDYYPSYKEVADPDKEIARLAENHWKVISCHADELETHLKALPPGRKQLAIARYEDQVTVVINEIDAVF